MTIIDRLRDSFNNTYYDTDNKILHFSKLFLVISLAFTIAAMIINSFYSIFLSYNILFKIGIIIFIISNIIYGYYASYIYNKDNIEIDNNIYSILMPMFFFIGIANVITGIPSDFTSGIIIIIGLFFAFFYIVFDKDQVLKRILLIIGIILLSYGLSLSVSPPFYFSFSDYFMNSAYWAIAIIIFLVFDIISLFFGNGYISRLFNLSGKSLAIFIFGIGNISGGAIILGFSSGPYFNGLLSEADVARIIYIFAGSFSIIAGVFIVIYSFLYFYNSLKRGYYIH
ncbi:hypothetical protein [Picrophilus oshimae]|uniref:Hypothetical membrane spanning protein n=1 Tax=Picrophilus torridus (strain ATCC 700027 / DSM 9790 / JCM 10055 / NBRC 100828 / KAW 2/3) TaxID=1122961 RepID=Q6L2Q1_PICTO|nr:hypothetical protein [Picrophilus oshimae]AAT42751.1 hypothetical membrane spanning protein [Picrophilus oshimae DSM 9789]SMD31539.1 hypothetical protein SAMN02745355_1488 [Picrophilus oshimae DSM 9789]